MRSTSPARHAGMHATVPGGSLIVGHADEYGADPPLRLTTPGGGSRSHSLYRRQAAETRLFDHYRIGGCAGADSGRKVVDYMEQNHFLPVD